MQSANNRPAKIPCSDITPTEQSYDRRQISVTTYRHAGWAVLRRVYCAVLLHRADSAKQLFYNMMEHSMVTG